MLISPEMLVIEKKLLAFTSLLLLLGSNIHSMLRCSRSDKTSKNDTIEE